MVVEVAMNGQINYCLKIIYLLINILSMNAFSPLIKKKLSVDGSTCPSIAMKLAASFSGVESIALKGDDKSQIEVTGDGVDPVKLTTFLRKKMGHAKLLSVSDADKKPEEKKPEEVNVQPLQWLPMGTIPHCQVFHLN